MCFIFQKNLTDTPVLPYAFGRPTPSASQLRSVQLSVEITGVN